MEFIKKNGLLTASLLFLVLAIFAPISLPLTMFAIFSPVLMIIVAVIITAATFANKKLVGKDVEDEGIFFEVPKNHVMVLRNKWMSDPKNPEKVIEKYGLKFKGYTGKTEGMNWHIPKWWHVKEGLVDLKAKQLEVDPFEINCTDGTNVIVDPRVTWYVRPYDVKSAIYFKINCDGSDEEAAELVRQRILTSVNWSMNMDSDVATQMEMDQKKAFSDEVTKNINKLLKMDGAIGFPKDKLPDDGLHRIDYGIEARINIENISSTEKVQQAQDAHTAAKMYVSIKEQIAIGDENHAKALSAGGVQRPEIVMASQEIGKAIENGIKSLAKAFSKK